SSFLRRRSFAGTTQLAGTTQYEVMDADAPPQRAGGGARLVAARRLALPLARVERARPGHGRADRLLRSPVDRAADVRPAARRAAGPGRHRRRHRTQAAS